MFTIGAGIVLAVSASAGYYLQQAREPSLTSAPARPNHESIIGQPRPAFALPDLEGERQAISQWDGRIRVINFWATWCQPCKEEIPGFVELQEKYRDQGVTFVGVAVDQLAAVRDFAERYDMNYPVLIGEQAAIDAAIAYGNLIGALPYTAFVDRDGTIVYVHRGRLPLEQAEKLLRELLQS